MAQQNEPNTTPEVSDINERVGYLIKLAKQRFDSDSQPFSSMPYANGVCNSTEILNERGTSRGESCNTFAVWQDNSMSPESERQARSVGLRHVTTLMGRLFIIQTMVHCVEGTDPYTITTKTTFTENCNNPINISVVEPDYDTENIRSVLDSVGASLNS